VIADPGRPTQAVILAGGLGTRLRPLTDTRPKPMIEFHGRPFLEYLIEMLRDRGLRRILLLLGYLPDVVRDHFGDGSAFGVEIDYVVSPVEDETGARLRHALPRIDPVFCLLYCDNYWPMPFEAMWRRFTSTGAPAMVTVYANEDRHTRDNLRVDDDGFVAVYDKSRSAPGLQGVDIGFLILRREVVEGLPAGNVSFEGALYPRLVAERALSAYVTEHRYYSVGDPRRLPVTEAFLARRPAVILDRDGVLNERMPRARYVRSPAEWNWLPGARESLRRFAENGFRVIVVTNQAGIGRGAMTEVDLTAVHDRLRREASAAGGRIDAIYHCPHDWDEGCACRKPKPGMLFEAQRAFDLDLSRVTFVGDDERDGEAAAAAGCPFAMVTDDMPLAAIAERVISETLQAGV
jgi:D-glycero-D-manno-heptose 1,7-bisphosphate phosphatase